MRLAGMEAPLRARRDYSRGTAHGLSVGSRRTSQSARVPCGAVDGSAHVELKHAPLLVKQHAEALRRSLDPSAVGLGAHERLPCERARWACKPPHTARLRGVDGEAILPCR
eukprot:3937988-Pleurochrysis_carterae.AAC.1